MAPQGPSGVLMQPPACRGQLLGGLLLAAVACIMALIMVPHPAGATATSTQHRPAVDPGAGPSRPLVMAKQLLLAGRVDDAWRVTGALCGDLVGQGHEQARARANQTSLQVSVERIACLNLLGLGLFMQGQTAPALEALYAALEVMTSTRQPPYDLVELETLKNLHWALQASNVEAPMLRLREHLKEAIIESGGLRPWVGPFARGLALSIFDLGLNGRVCNDALMHTHMTRRLQQRSEEGDGAGPVVPTAEELYLDSVKRTVTYFTFSDIPHELMPRVEWDIYYRMRDFQTAPPKDGKKFESGFTIKEVGVLNLIQEAALAVVRDGVEGDWLEAGVWRGGTSILLRAIVRAYKLQDRAVILADSFKGIPDGALGEWGERYAVAKETVMDNLDRFGLLDTQSGAVRFVEGFFSESLPAFASSPSTPKLSLLLADADAFSSTWDILESLYPLLSVGGYVVVDDFHIPECRRAVLQYREARGISEPMIPIPSDYVFSCRETPDGTLLTEDASHVTTWPHAMYWRRTATEEQLKKTLRAQPRHGASSPS